MKGLFATSGFFFWKERRFYSIMDVSIQFTHLDENDQGIVDGSFRFCFRLPRL